MDTTKEVVVIYILASIIGAYLILSLIIFFRPSLIYSKGHLYISSDEEVAGDTDAKTEFDCQVEKKHVLEYEVEVSDGEVFAVCEETISTEKDVIDENSPFEQLKKIKFEDVLTKSKKIPTIICVKESDPKLEDLQKIHDLIKKHNRMGLVIWGSPSRKTRHVLYDLDDSMLVYIRPSLKLYMCYFTGILPFVTFDTNSVLIISHCFRKKVDENGSLSWLSKLHEWLSNMFLWSLGPMINHFKKRGIRTYLIGSNQNNEKVPAGIALIVDKDNLIHASMSGFATCEQHPESSIHLNSGTTSKSDPTTKSVTALNSNASSKPDTIRMQVLNLTQFLSLTSLKHDTGLNSFVRSKSDTTPEPVTALKSNASSKSDTSVKHDTALNSFVRSKSDTTPEPVTALKSNTSSKPDTSVKHDTALNSFVRSKSDTTPEPVTALKSNTSSKPDTSVKHDTALKSCARSKSDTTPESVTALKFNATSKPDTSVKHDTTLNSFVRSKSDTTPESVTALKSNTSSKPDTSVKHDTALKSCARSKSDTAPESVKARALKFNTSLTSDTTAKDDGTNTALMCGARSKFGTTSESVTAISSNSNTSFVSDRRTKSDTARKSKACPESGTTPEPFTTLKSNAASKPDTSIKHDTALKSCARSKSDTTPEPVTTLKSNTSSKPDTSIKHDTALKYCARSKSDTTSESVKARALKFNKSVT